MIITFVRSGERTYSTTAVRDDGVTLEVPSYDRTAPLPHDLAHYVVERALGLKRGFWGSVADGAIFPGIKVVAGRPSVRAGERSQIILREIGQQGTEAEVLVGTLLEIMHAGIENNRVAVQKRLSEMWRPGKGARQPLRHEEVERVCAALREAEAQWQALEVGEAMMVEWRTEKRREQSR